MPAENDFVREVLRFYPNLTEAQLRVVLVNDGPVILPELRERLGTYAEKKLTERKVEMRVNTKIIRHEISRCATTCPHCGAPRGLSFAISVTEALRPAKPQENRPV